MSGILNMTHVCPSDSIHMPLNRSGYMVPNMGPSIPSLWGVIINPEIKICDSSEERTGSKSHAQHYSIILYNKH